jgi:hypothetical protein
MTAIEDSLECLDLSEIGIAILIRLADCADDDGFYVSPNIDYLIKKTGFPQTSIRKAIKSLGERGLLFRVADCSTSPPFYGSRINTELLYKGDSE